MKHVQMRAGEPCGSVVNNGEWSSRIRHFFFFIFSALKGEYLPFFFLSNKSNYLTAYLKKSITLAGDFDQDAVHS